MSESLAPPLTPDEERFVEEYLIDFNGTAAYLRVHPHVKRSSAGTESYKLLKKPEIQEAIEAGRAELRERTQITAEKVIAELAMVAFFDPGAVADLSVDELRLLGPRNIPFDVRKAIAGMKSKRRVVNREDGTTEEFEEREYRFANKLEALSKLAQHLGLLKDLPALEVLLGALPADIAEKVRAAIAASIHAGGTGSGSPDAGNPGQCDPPATPG